MVLMAAVCVSISDKLQYNWFWVPSSSWANVGFGVGGSYPNL